MAYPMYNYISPYPNTGQPIIQPSYQPMDRLQQLQQNYQNTIPQYQHPQMAQQQMYGLNGEIVDGIDVVKAKNVDMTGAVVYYPQSNGEAIYTKQLQPDGTSRILTYRISQDMPKEQVQQSMNPDVLNEMFVQLRQDLLSEINGIKEMIPVLFGNSEQLKNERGSGQK